jgi:hypothetical protein
LTRVYKDKGFGVIDENEKPHISHHPPIQGSFDEFSAGRL